MDHLLRAVSLIPGNGVQGKRTKSICGRRGCCSQAMKRHASAAVARCPLRACWMAARAWDAAKQDAGAGAASCLSAAWWTRGTSTWGAACRLPAEVHNIYCLQVPRTQAGTGWLEPGKSSIELSQCITRAVPVSARRSSVGKVSCRARHAWLLGCKGSPQVLQRQHPVRPAVCAGPASGSWRCAWQAALLHNHIPCTPTALF